MFCKSATSDSEFKLQIQNWSISNYKTAISQNTSELNLQTGWHSAANRYCLQWYLSTSNSVALCCRTCTLNAMNLYVGMTTVAQDQRVKQMHWRDGRFNNDSRKITTITWPGLMSTVWVKKIPPWGFLTFFPNGWEFLVQILHTYYTSISTLDSKFLSNYLQCWPNYATLGSAFQFTPYVKNVHHRPKRTLAFSAISPKQLGIFGPSFMCLLHVPRYAWL